ncbi:patatin-like phospholipase family protein [Cohnella thermotolerans]|uniref:patatin-like phospholipase family protein n=1 Tax=Cohnella thermotolerans TaxID=329858 RepID=UPI00041A4F0A|nr:patatin-like phospholipase family protein [Cohnella thermotolerans]
MKVNGVFEGGGVKGISLVGAVRAAELNGVSFHKVAGTSSGGIVAALLATGYTAEEMKRAIQAVPFTSFLRRSRFFNVRFIGPAVRLLLKKGLYSGDALEEWVRGLLAAKNVRTFADLPLGKLRIIASDITNGKILVLPDGIAEYGIDPLRLEIAKAVRMSASIPYFFDPVILLQSNRHRYFKRRRKAEVKSTYIVDGGLLSNFPLWVFDRDNDSGKEPPLPVVGFQMVGRRDAKARRIGGPISMFQAMFETMLNAHDERYIEEHNRIRTIKIATLGVGTADFSLSPEMSEKLYESGLEAGDRFFKQCDRQTGTLPVAGSSSPQIRLK